MSSGYVEDEIEQIYWLYKMRKRKMQKERRIQTFNEFKEDLAKMKTFEKGWFDGEGEPISEAVIILASLKMSGRFIERPPHVFPTPEGGLSLEWDTEEELDAEINPDLKGVMIWKDKAEYRDWNKEESWRELEEHWKEALAMEKEGSNGS